MLDLALAKDNQVSEGGWLTKLQAFLAKSESKSQGALIRFEQSSCELVLGLHPDTYMNDPHLSAYARRTLARSGPFLTDQEREYVSMALKDCLQHVIVSLASERISCNLLEFLCRLAFTWKFRKQELTIKDEEAEKSPVKPSLNNAALMAGAGGQALMVAPNTVTHDTEELGHQRASVTGSLVAKFAGSKWRKKAVHNMTRMMFDDATFENGMTAADFQSELMQVMSMSKKKFEELFKDFAGVKEEMAAGN